MVWLKLSLDGGGDERNGATSGLGEEWKGGEVPRLDVLVLACLVVDAL